MNERRSELKVIWVVVAVLSSALLGVDFQVVAGIFSDPLVLTGVDEITQRATQLTAGHERMTLATMLAAVGGVYTAGRTVVKSVNRWVEGKEAEVVLGKGGTNEGSGTAG